MSEIRIGAPDTVDVGAPAFAVSRDSGGILVGVRDNAAPQFAVSRDSGGLLLSVLPVPLVAHAYVLDKLYYAAPNQVRSWAGTYEAARAGVSKQVQGAAYIDVGQSLAAYFEVYQAYLRFDSSVIPDNEAVVSAVLSLNLADDYSDTDFIIEARAYDAGATVTTADYVPGADLSALPLFGTCDTAGGLGTPSVFTEAEGAAAMVDTGGFTGLLLCSNHTTSGVAPTNLEFVQFHAVTLDLVTLTITTSGPA